MNNIDKTKHLTAIDRQEKIFRDWYLKGIESTYAATQKDNAGSPLMAYILSSCLIDSLAGYYQGRTKASGFTKNYLAFIDRYIRPLSSEVADNLWQIRCNLVHDFTLPGSVSLSHNQSPLHGALTETGLVINFDNLWDVIKKAFDKYFIEVRQSDELMEKFFIRCKALKTVGPVHTVFSG